MQTSARTGRALALKLAAVTGTALLLSGCSGLLDSTGKPDPVVNLVATLDHCGLAEARIYSASQPAADFSADLQQVIADIDLPESRTALVVSLGNQPTPGYSLALLNARWFGEATLNLSMAAEKPSDEAFSAQVITTPCVIVDVPAEGWSQVRVEADLPGFPVAWVRREE